MTMIIGVIADSGIILASDTRCMIGSPKKYVGYHEQARKIAISPNRILPPVACAVACSSEFSFGESIINHANGILSDNRSHSDNTVCKIHLEFNHRINQINTGLFTDFSVISIFAMFENNVPHISYSSLKSEVKVQRKIGIYSYPIITKDVYNSFVPTKDEAIGFVKGSIMSMSTVNETIGNEIDILHISNSHLEWIQGESREIFPIKKKELYKKYLTDREKFKATYDYEILENYLKDNY